MEISKEVKEYVKEPLTRSELNRLKKMVLGYGNFKKTAVKLEMPITTLRDVINKEYGEPETIEKIRRVFAPEVKDNSDNSILQESNEN